MSALESDDEADTFFKVLAGRGDDSSGAAEVRTAVALRDALRERAATFREASAATRDDWNADDVAVMRALKQRLLDRKIIGSPAPETRRARIPFVRFWVGRASDENRPLASAFYRWRVVVPVVASIVFASALVAVSVGRNKDDLQRGAAVRRIEVVVTDPAATAGEFAARATAAGSPAEAIPLGDVWLVEGDVPDDPAGKAALDAALADAGVRVTQRQRYSILFRYARWYEFGARYGADVRSR